MELKLILISQKKFRIIYNSISNYFVMSTNIPKLSSQYFNSKVSIKNITIELDEDEDIFSCIKQAMLENKIKEVDILEIKGTLYGKVNYMIKSQYKHKDIKNVSPINCSGHFKLNRRSNNELFGNIKIVLQEGISQNTYTLATGKSKEGLKIKMKFLDLNEN